MAIPKAQMIEALRKNAGQYSLTAKALTDAGMPITRQGVRLRVERDPKLLELCKELEETVTDMSVGAVVKAIISGSTREAMWWLEHKGADRGFVTRREHTGKGGGPIAVDFDALFDGMTEDEIAAVNRLREAARRRRGPETTPAD